MRLYDTKKPKYPLPAGRGAGQTPQLPAGARQPLVRFDNVSGYEFVPAAGQPPAPSFPKDGEYYNYYNYYHDFYSTLKAERQVQQPISNNTKPPVSVDPRQKRQRVEQVEYAANQTPEVLVRLFDDTYRQEEVSPNTQQMPQPWPPQVSGQAVQNFLKKCTTPRDAVEAKKGPGQDAFFNCIELTAKNDPETGRLVALIMLCRMAFHGRSSLYSSVQDVCNWLRGYLARAWPMDFCVTAQEAHSKLKGLPGNPSIHGPITGLINSLDPGAAIGQPTTEEPVQTDWRLDVPPGPVLDFLKKYETSRDAVEATKSPLPRAFLNCIERTWQDCPKSGEILALFFLCRMAFFGGTSSNLSVREACARLKPYLPTNTWPTDFCVSAQEARSSLKDVPDTRNINGPIRELIDWVDKRLPE